MKNILIAVVLLMSLAITACGSSLPRLPVDGSPDPATPTPTPTAPVTLTAAQVFNPAIGTTWTFQNGYGELTFITFEAVPPSNYVTPASVSMVFTKNACRAYWGAGICDALLHFVLSPQPNGSWISPASLFYFPTQIPDYMNGHRLLTADFVQVPGMPVPYTIVPASATTSIINSVSTQYDRYDKYDLLTFDSVVYGSPSARIAWRTDSYIENVSTPIYTGPAMVSEQFESTCIHEKWYFASGKGLVEIVPLDNGSCVPTDPLLAIKRIS